MHRLVRFAVLVRARLSARTALLVVALLATMAAGFAQTIPGLTPSPAAPAAQEPVPDLAPEAAARALVEILGDDAARARLVEELRAIAERPPQQPGAAGEPAPAVDPATEPDTSLARELGVYTQSAAEDVLRIVTRITGELANLRGLVDGTIPVDWQRLGDQTVSLLILGLIAYATLLAARWAAQWPLHGLSRAAEGKGITRRVLLVLVAVAIDLVALALAWSAAFSHLVGAASEPHVVLLESLFLNAFVLVETIKLALRAVLQPRWSRLRLLPLEDGAAKAVHRRLAALIAFTVYGVMLVYPMVNAAVSLSVGRGVRLLIVLLAAASAVAMAVRHRTAIHDGLVDLSRRLTGAAASATVALIAQVWHVLVIGYVLTAVLVWLTRPFDAVSFMASATVQTLLSIAVGATLASILGRAIAGGIRLPAEVKEPLPLLEDRLNLLVPALLRVVRLLLLVAVAAAVLQAWALVDIPGWMRSEGGSAVVGRVVTALLVVLVAMAIWIATTSWIEYRLNPAVGTVSTPRARTLLALFRNAFTVLLAIVAGMLALSELGVDIAPLIAGAGVLGLAIGFGSQKLVQDIITGAFIQFENAMNEGDVVTVAGITGVVEHLTIRSVGLRDVNGVFHVIPFSSVDSVSNAMRGFAFHVADISVAYSTDVALVKRLMGEAFERLMAGEHAPSILEPLDVQGVVSIIGNAMVIRGRIKTLPGQQWAVGRAYSEAVKALFDANGVEIPIPQSTLRFADAPPAALEALGGPAATGGRQAPADP